MSTRAPAFPGLNTHPHRKAAFLATIEIYSRAAVLGQDCKALTGLTPDEWRDHLAMLGVQIAEGRCDLTREKGE